MQFTYLTTPRHDQKSIIIFLLFIGASLIWELLDLDHGLDDKKTLNGDEGFPLMNRNSHFHVVLGPLLPLFVVGSFLFFAKRGGGAKS